MSDVFEKFKERLMELQAAETQLKELLSLPNCNDCQAVKGCTWDWWKRSDKLPTAYSEDQKRGEERGFKPGRRHDLCITVSFKP